LDSDHDAVRPVITYHPGINFVEAWKALSRCHFLPVAQHTLDQTPFVLPGSRRAGFWQFRHVVIGGPGSVFIGARTEGVGLPGNN